MNKKTIEKNILDLEYKKHLQKTNTSLILGTIGLILLLSSFIWDPRKIIIGLSLSATIMSLSYVWYKNTEEKLKSISKKIKDL